MQTRYVEIGLELAVYLAAVIIQGAKQLTPCLRSPSNSHLQLSREEVIDCGGLPALTP